MKKAHKAYQRFTSDEALTDAYEARLKYQRDKAAEISYAHNEGIRQGSEKTNMENARKMEEKGISYEVIFEITGISEELLKAEK
ncbi:MAG: hypothetical protein PQJ58_06790 [Spirochaetales bacterium]|nr:hypothetical protein [Spirochaetales bacterium]